MKRTLFTTAILLSLLSSCQKETSSVQKEAEPIVFTACIAESADTKVSVDCTAGKVSWVAGDSIFISNGSVTKTYIADKSGATTTFTVKASSAPGFTEAAQYSATYGTMPSPGAAQQYSATPGALVYMEAPETESTSTPNFTFDVKCGLLKLNLTASGKSVKRISVSDGTNTYSLVCETAQSIGTATDFYIALPAGNYTKYIIRDSEGYEAVKTAKSTGTAITSNQINKVTFNTLNFAAPKYTEGGYTGDGIKIGDNWWAPVNCGYDATNYPMGLLYQWGRKYGQGYKDSSYEDADYPGKAGGNQSLENSSSPQAIHPDGSTYNGNFYHDSSRTISNWYGGSDPDKLWNSNEGTSNPVSKSAYDPCPEGWRVPTMSELDRLGGGDGSGSASLGGSGWDSTNKGYWFNGTSTPSINNGLFLPAAGCRDYGDGSASDRGDYGGYWSSSVSGDYAGFLYIIDDFAIMYYSSRAYGCSVRCVQE